MKRFLTLVLVMTYSGVGCVGSNKWVKPDFRAEEFETDRQECIQSIDKGLVSDAFGQALEECLAKKGYKFDQRYKDDGHKYHEHRKLTTVEKILLCAVLIPLGVAFLIASAGGGVGAGAFGGLSR